MRWFVLMMALWFAPVSFGNDSTEEDLPGWSARPRACAKCQGGKCKVYRPRPRLSR